MADNETKVREVLNRVHEFLSNLCRDARCDDHCSECLGASDLADDVYDLLHAPATEKEGVTDEANNNSKDREVLNRVHEFLSNLCRDARCDDHCSECLGASDLADDVYDLLHAPATKEEGGNDALAKSNRNNEVCSS